MPVTAGVASFTTLTLANPGTNFTLTATAGSLTSAPSAGITVTAITVPPPTPPPAPQIRSASVVFTQKTNPKTHKKIGRPVLTGYQFTFNTAMNSSTTGNSANYQVQTYAMSASRSGRKFKEEARAYQAMLASR